MKAQKLAVVAGATGYLGRFVVRALHEDGWRVRALARSEEKLKSVRSCCDEVFVGQATEMESLEALCSGADLVFSSLGVRAVLGKITYEDVDFQANMNLLERSQEENASRFVFVSVAHGPKLRSLVPQADARERVVDALKASDLPWTVLRPTGFFNDMGEFFDMARRGKAWVIGDGSTRLNPIHGADLARFIADRAQEEDSVGKEYDVGGPEAFSQREICELAFEVLGKKARIGSVPVGLVRGLGSVARPFSANLSNFLKFMAALGSLDAVAEATGDCLLRDHFEQLRKEITPSPAE